jgi:hypothetical protein
LDHSVARRPGIIPARCTVVVGACGGRTDGGTDRRGSCHAGTPVSPPISIATVIAIMAPVGVAAIDAAGTSSKRQSFSGQ